MRQQETTGDMMSPTNTKQVEAKPEPIEKWENEGGQIIPTGSLRKVTFPLSEEEETKSQPNY